MGYDRRLCADVLAVFIAALRRSLRHRAKRELGLRSVDDAQIGALTFVQRGDSSLRLNVHFHSLALDGVYVRDDANVLQFHALSTPTPEQVAEVARWTYEGLARVCERHGRSFDELDTDADTDELAHDQPALAACYGASVSDRQLLGAAPGNARASSCIRSARSLHPASRSPKLVGSTYTQARRSTAEIVVGSSDYAGTSRDRQSLRSGSSSRRIANA